LHGVAVIALFQRMQPHFRKAIGPLKAMLEEANDETDRDIYQDA
jgi:hypothetical protein